MSFAVKAPVQRAHRGQQHTFPIGTICLYTRIRDLLTWPMQRNSDDICTRDPSICMSVDAPRRRVIFSVNPACESQGTPLLPSGNLTAIHTAFARVANKSAAEPLQGD